MCYHEAERVPRVLDLAGEQRERMPREPIDPVTRARVIGGLFALAILLAPFIALLYGTSYGLGMMAIALGATAFLAWDARSQVDPPMYERLAILAAVNLLLAVGAIVVLIATR